MANIYAIGGGFSYPIIINMINFSGTPGMPNILIVMHSKTSRAPYSYENKFQTILANNFSKDERLNGTRAINPLDISETEIDRLIKWADIIYVCPGDTNTLLREWKQVGFGERMIEIFKNDKRKLLAGVSSGANCWFSSYTTELSDRSIEAGAGLGLIDAHISCHSDKKEIRVFHERTIKENGKLGILLPNNTAIATDGNNCKFIVCNGGTILSPKEKPIVSYYDEGEYQSAIIPSSTEIMAPLNKTLVKKRYDTRKS